ncbi:MAG: nucleotidyltransferase [Balneolales bacterium]
MILNKDFKEFIGLLNDHKVEYLLVGGYAVIIHGYPRYTGDIDIWIKPTRTNAQKLLRALADFGFADLNLGVDDFTEPNQIIQLGQQPTRIDLLTSVDGIEFEESSNNAMAFTIENILVRVIGITQLRENKQASGRHKDLDDLKNLPPR